MLWSIDFGEIALRPFSCARCETPYAFSIPPRSRRVRREQNISSHPLHTHSLQGALQHLLHRREIEPFVRPRREHQTLSDHCGSFCTPDHGAPPPLTISPLLTLIALYPRLHPIFSSHSHICGPLPSWWLLRYRLRERSLGKRITTPASRSCLGCSCLHGHTHSASQHCSSSFSLPALDELGGFPIIA